MTRAELQPALQKKLTDLIEEGRDFFHKFDLETRSKHFHPFVPANYDEVLETLLSVAAPGLKFLEWGSGTGVIAIMADLLGMEGYGIELYADLVEEARRLAAKYGSNAKFAVGSFLPTGYVYHDATGDTRTGTLGEIADSGYLALKMPLDEFDVVYGYPWPGEADVMRDVFKKYGRSDAKLLVQKGA